MAVLTISRQIASLGDEISTAIAQKLNYKFVTRSEVEERIVRLGFPQKKLRRYDDKKPGFFASLSNERDEYLDYLQTAILEMAEKNNCVLVGMGSFVILKELQNHISLRIVANKKDRIERYKKEFNVDEKTAVKKLDESDSNKRGFYKSFFNLDNMDPSLYHLVVNAGLLDVDSIADLIASLIQKNITSQKEEAGQKKLELLLIGQRLVNMLVFDYGLNINYLRVEMKDGKIVLHGVADSHETAKRALTIVECEIPSYEIESLITVVQDFKAYGR